MLSPIIHKKIYFFFILGEIDDRDMFDYLHLTAAGYEKVFEPLYELLTQLLTEGEPEPDLDKILQD